MSAKKTAWKTGVLALACFATSIALLIPCGRPSGAADANFTYGQALFAKGDFKNASRYFGAAYQSNPRDLTTIRYLATCYQRQGDMANAKKWADYFTSLQRAQGAGAPQQASSTVESVRVVPSGGAPSEGNLPEICRIPFVKEGRLLTIDASINNRPVRMCFDTGAEQIAFGQNHLEGIIRGTEGQPVGAAAGVGSSGTVPVWVKQVTMKVGSIERRNCPIMIQQNMPAPAMPLLGQEFYKDYEYTIDYQGAEKDRGTITFVKKGSSTAGGPGGGLYSVPFTREGNELVVTVEVNGRPCQMYFDTGAAGIIFTEEQLKKAGVTIPDDAVPEQHGGIGGMTSGKGFALARMRMGPIDKSNVWVSALTSANMRHGLLGQPFYSDWQYTIDTAHNMIRFVRR